MNEVEFLVKRGNIIISVKYWNEYADNTSLLGCMKTGILDFPAIPKLKLHTSATSLHRTSLFLRNIWLEIISQIKMKKTKQNKTRTKKQ